MECTLDRLDQEVASPKLVLSPSESRGLPLLPSMGLEVELIVLEVARINHKESHLF